MSSKQARYGRKQHAPRPADDGGPFHVKMRFITDAAGVTRERMSLTLPPAEMLPPVRPDARPTWVYYATCTQEQHDRYGSIDYVIEAHLARWPGEDKPPRTAQGVYVMGVAGVAPTGYLLMVLARERLTDAILADMFPGITDEWTEQSDADRQHSAERRAAMTAEERAADDALAARFTLSL